MVEELQNLPFCKKKILFIDPDTVSYYLVSKVLAEHHVEIIHARCGPGAIRIFKEYPFIDAVITEIKVPGMDGFEILRAVRQINPFITVIAQTASVHNKMRQRCLGAGFNEYISKPIKINLFFDIIKKCILFS